jgi:signal transduction histidine kinase
VTLLLGLGWLSCVLVEAQKASNWRMYKAADGLRESLTTAVTPSPRGNLWIRHGEMDTLSVLDGYTIRHLPAPAQYSYRVYESAAGKVWSVGTKGLLEFVAERWLSYPIEEVRLEHEASLLRQLRQTPILPAEEDRVLLLLPDRLVEHRTTQAKINVLRLAQATKLGKFTDLIRASDGGVWVAGANGLAKLPGPLRRLNAATPWAEHVLPAELRVQNLQRPFEDDDGGITAVGDSLVTERRVLVHYDGAKWLTHQLPGQNLRFAWRGAERDRFWAATVNSLVRFYPDHTEVVKEGGLISQYHDVAVQPRGVFWIATLEGLMRYAPLAWRTPEGAEDFNTVVHALMQDNTGGLWCAGADALLEMRDGAWQKHPWPETFEPTFRARDGLFALPNGQIAIGAAGQVLLFSPATGQFTPLAHPKGHRLRRILRQQPDGALCLQTTEASAAAETGQFELYDGRSFRPLAEGPPPLDLGSELFFLAQAQSGDWWLGGSAGPAVWREKKWQRFGPADGYTDDGALCWLEMGEGRIWCAGLRKVSEFDGKSWAVVHGGLDRVSAMIKASDGSVWLPTSSGLYRGYKDSWTWVGEEEGLPSSATFAVLEDRARRLWVGTSRGLSQYFPRADIDPPRTIRLKPDQTGEVSAETGVEVFLEGIDKWKYTPVERLLYSHRLDEGNWSPFRTRTSVALRDLPPGKHRLEVRAMDRNWNIEPQPAALELSVVVPWYREPRVIAVLAIGAFGVLFFAGLAVNRHLQLRRSYARVEKIVAERTHELALATQELVHSQKMTALGTLAAGIAHDFNNILSIIRGSVQVIETNLDDHDKILTRVSRIKTVTDQAAGIVHAMLGFGRAADRQITACDTALVIEETIRLLGDRFLRGVSIVRQLAPDLPPVRSVKDLLQQMLLNLILNAADAMAGSGEIHLLTGRLRAPPPRLILPPSPAQEYVFVAVRDSGCGISPEVLPRIFDPFFTTKAFSTKRGTGLGLYMVYSFAKELGHGLAVESNLGEGSTFTVFLPVMEPGP